MTNTYRITFRDHQAPANGASGAPAEEVQASMISHAHDGTVSWIIFHDEQGEVLRVRSDDVDRVDRVAPAAVTREPLHQR